MVTSVFSTPHLESLPLSVLVFERTSHVVTFATQAACQLFTSTVGDVLGGRVESLWSSVGGFDDCLVAWEKSAAVSHRAECQPAAAGDSALEFELSAIGSDQVCMVLSKPTLSREGAVAEVASERERAMQRLEALGTLAGGIAHDFNNMLTVIETHAGFLRRYFEPTHPERGNVEIVLHAAERAARLTSQLLAFSRRQIQELEITSLNAVVRGLAPIIKSTLGNQIVCKLELGAELWNCRVDVAQMEQVITNLVLNARDAMPEGGTLEIRTANVTLDATPVPQTSAFTQPGRYVFLSVKDNGLGMDSATRQRAFEPFFTTKDPLLSSGLGLATAYGVIKQSRGYIWAESALGQGTHLQIYLPQAELAEQDAAPSTPRRPAYVALTGRHVLVVEDEPLVRRAARRILEREGCHVLEASDGVAALELCEKTGAPIDLVVTDMVMPKMNGRELAERLAQTYPNIAVLLMSGYTDEVVVSRAMQARGATFLQKPFAPEALLRKAEQALAQQLATLNK